MQVVKWRPFEDLLNISDEMNRMFDEVLGERRKLSRIREKEDISWMPRVDISEKENKIVLRADLPGIDKDDIKISFSDNVVTISGEKRIEKDEKKRELSSFRTCFRMFHAELLYPYEHRSGEYWCIV
jgi:HSP20 family protein